MLLMVLALGLAITTVRAEDPATPAMTQPIPAAVSAPAITTVAAPAPVTTAETRPPVKPALDATPIRRATPDAPESPGWGGSGALQVGGALAVIVGLLLLARGLLRKFAPQLAPSPGTGVMEVLARTPLSKTQSLVLVRIGGRIVVLNQGRDASHAVLTIQDPDEVAALLLQLQPGSAPASFPAALAHAKLDLANARTVAELEAAGDEPLEEELEAIAAARRQLFRPKSTG